jgi:hypothetical protein
MAALGAAAIAVAASALVGSAAVAGSIPGARHVGVITSARANPCKRSAVTETLSTNAAGYGPGTIVWMTASVKNRSTKNCSVWIGPTSPYFTVTSSSGTAVWDSCSVDDQPGACAQYLIAKVLKHGARYSETVRWDQTTGNPPTRVVTGTYDVTVDFAGPRGKRSASITLTN